MISPTVPQTARDEGIDALRGVAILTMVASHLARDILPEPHPFWLRVYGSVAAPMFILLAGMMTGRTQSRRNHPLWYYVERGLFVVVIAALLDVCLWGIYPFVSFDVLYLIGVALPVTALFARFSARWQTGILVLVLLISPLLRRIFGYPPHVLSLSLDDPLSVYSEYAGRIVHQFWISGWFPVFPWIFFSLLGIRIFQWRSRAPEHFERYLLRAGVPLIILGALCAWDLPIRLFTRQGYTELFYPASIAYVLIASGAVLLIFRLAGFAWFQHCRPLVHLGRCSLAMYLIHLAIIHLILRPGVGKVDLAGFLAGYGLLMLVLVLLATAIDAFKGRIGGHMPAAAKILLGG
jgi:uncharacterized membrane protein